MRQRLTGGTRFHYMFDFLELPVTHLRILDKSEVEEQEKSRKGGNVEAKARL